MAGEKPSLIHLDEEELNDDAKKALDEIAKELPTWQWEGEDLVSLASHDLTQPHKGRVLLIRSSCKNMPKGKFAWLIARQINTAQLPKEYLPAIIIPLEVHGNPKIKQRDLRVGWAVTITELGAHIPSGVTILVLRSAEG